MKKLLIFNWKENPNSIEEAEKILASVLALAKNAKETEMVVCPPDVYLEHVSQVIGQKSEVRLGAQNLSTEESGAHTGEISGGMLKNLGVTYVIVGHSERRRLGETDEIVAKKISVAIKDGLVPILCVGEELEVRNQGMDVVKDFIKNQLDKDLPRDSASSQRSSALLVAYEPIWAIGTGKPCEPKDAAEVIRFIKETLHSKFNILNSRILYGGSVTGKNIMDFVQLEDIGGALVGGASLEPEQFLSVIH